jgi:nitroimidazol reductase NimA-like FMN-containing flavoprotein (pyridoxamine 5'-phosphate oxidase superfamily)
MLSTAASGVDVSIAVTLVDGLVMARSMFHHSINYRSVVVFGHAVPVADREEKMRALECFSEHLAPGRWSEARAPNESELDATLVLRLKIEEASAKVRTGPPIDDEEDMRLPVWAGVLPLSMVAGEPQTDPKLPEDVEVAPSVRNWRR